MNRAAEEVELPPANGQWKRLRVDDVDIGDNSDSEGDAVHNVGFVAHEGLAEEDEPAAGAVFDMGECERNCRVNQRGRDGWDIRCHKMPDGTAVPCPLIFKDAPIPLRNHVFQPWDPEQLTIKTIEFVQTERALYEPVWSMLDHSLEDSKSRDTIREFFFLAGLHFIAADITGINLDPSEVTDVGDIKDVLRMMEYLQRPFATVDSLESQADKNFLIDTYSNFVRFSQPFHNMFSTVLQNIRQVVRVCVGDGRITESQGRDLYTEITLITNRRSIVIQARESVLNPNANIFSRVDPDNPRHMAMNEVQVVLAAAKAIVVDTASEEKVLMALPIQSRHNVPTFTYTGKMPIMKLLQKLKADQVVVENYTLFRRFINGTFSGSNSGSQIPLVEENFSDAMRYISCPTGVFCCRTMIMYYHKNKLPNTIPDNWKFYSHHLRDLNEGNIRAMKYIEQELDYYGVITDMLAGVWVRENSDAAQQRYDASEQEMVGVGQGSEWIIQDCPEQEEWIKDRWEHFDQWIHDADFMAKMDPLDVQMRSIQKIFQDQQLPRDAYRSILCSFGRCFSGVMGRQTRMSSASHRLLEKRVGRQVNDRLEYATVLEGTAGTGKSTLLDKVEMYFDEELIGRLSDNRRPIDPYGTIRNKAVVIASDMQKEEKTPVPTGDLKKMVSNEAVVNHRLHQDSVIVRFLQHVIFAMNESLPYKDNKGDIGRRFEQQKFQHRISSKNTQFSAEDVRSLDEVFEEEDLHRFPIVCVFGHLRRLLNVGNRSFYRPMKKGFEVPRYLQATQAEYGRMQNSFRAFILSLEVANQLSMERDDLNMAVERKIVIEEYKNYCDQWKCPVMDDKAIDKYCMSTFGLRVSGVPQRYCGIRYKDMSVDLAGEGDDGDPMDEPDDDQGGDIGVGAGVFANDEPDLNELNESVL